MLSLFQNQLAQATTWLTTAEQLLDNSDPSSPAQKTRIDYYTAQLRYKQEDYPTARTLYQRILAGTEASQEETADPQQQQIKVYSLNWLVDLELQAENIQTAEQLLEQSWAIIQHQEDKRSHAFHQRSKAQLEKLLNHPSAFRHWCLQARASFRALGMQPQAQEMQAWLNEETE